MEPPPSLFPTTSTPTAPGMSFNNHALMEFDITEQLNAYNESLMMNSNSTPDLQPEDVQDFHDVEDDDYQTAVLHSLYDDDDDDDEQHDPTSSNHNYHRPMSAYNLFLRDHNGPQQALVLQGRKPNTPLPPTLPEMMAQAWRGLSPAARAHYEGLATTERTEYLANVAAKKKKKQQQREQQQQRQMRQTVAAETKSSQNMLTAMTPAQLQQLEPRPLAQSQPLPTNGNNNGFLTNNNNNNNMIMMPQGTPTTDLSFMTPSYRRAIAELASKLDDASIDFLIRAFK